MVLLEMLAFALASSQIPNTVNQGTFSYYANSQLTKIVEMYNNECHIFVDSDASWIYKTRQHQINQLNSVQFELLMERCYANANKNLTQIHTGENETFLNETSINSTLNLNNTLNGEATENSFNSTEGAPFVYPGTKWCGKGDIAKSYDDIGIYAHTDMCCRDHDNCPDNILAGETKHGLTNNASFTSSHCDCDDKFLRCLRSDSTFSQLTSSKIAQIYFNILKPLCFDERHPVKSCQRRRITGECVTPEYNYREGRQWQFFSAQQYFAKTVRGLLDTFNSVFGPTEASVMDAFSQSGKRSAAMPPGFSF